jgi:hypothetical protein
MGMAVVLSGATLYAQPSTNPTESERGALASVESYRECDFPKIEGRLLVSLQHNVEGVVTSALREVARIKLAQPGCASSRITSQVQDLVQGGATPAIRFKAYLTSIVLSSPELFVAEGAAEYETDEQFFTALARKLENLALRDTP